MKRKTLLVLVPVAAVALYVGQSDRREPGPDERIGARLAKVCPIARDNVETPVRGVDALGRFFAENTPGVLHDFAELVVQIERIDDPRRRERRAEVGHTRMFAPMSRCHRALEQFIEAIDHDEEAKARWQAGVMRVNQTVRILLGDSPDRYADPSAVLELLRR
jgi:hypothetical protein